MPIKPENKARYPKEWKQIRVMILERAGNCCEFCKVQNYSVVERGAGKDAGTYKNDDGKVFCDETGEYLGMARISEYHVKAVVKIVLTIAHLDHTPENCDDANLKALCQRCHLKYDAQHHKINAARTRRKKLKQADWICEIDTTPTTCTENSGKLT